MLIKICGMTRQEDLDCANRANADYCGFIFHLRSPRYIDPQRVASLSSGDMKRVGVFTGANVEEMAATMRLARLDYAQLHGNQEAALARELGREKVIKVLWPQKYDSLCALIADAEAFAPYCAIFLLDSGTTGGGSGLAQNWQFLAGFQAPRPWFLAGGLNLATATMARQYCSPSGMDFNSGLEDAPGRKNHVLVKQTVSQLRRMDSCLQKELK